MTTKQVAVVTGGNSGIGLETCLAFASAGYLTYATMRDLNKQTALLSAAEHLGPETVSNLKVVELDQSKDSSVENAFKKILQESNHIDVLVNNAGMAYRGALESWTSEDILNQYNVNVVGVVRCTQQVLPGMRKRNSGRIINVSSLVAVYAPPLSSLYASSKMALEGITQGLYQDLKRWDKIKVILVQPGLTKSPFFDNDKYGGRKIEGEEELYDEDIKKFKEILSVRLSSADEVSDVAKVILKAATAEEPQFRYQIGERGEKYAASVLVESKKFNPPKV